MQTCHAFVFNNHQCVRFSALFKCNSNNLSHNYLIHRSHKCMVPHQNRDRNLNVSLSESGSRQTCNTINGLVVIVCKSSQLGKHAKWIPVNNSLCSLLVDHYLFDKSVNTEKRCRLRLLRSTFKQKSDNFRGAKKCMHHISFATFRN